MLLPTTLAKFIWHFIKKQKAYFIAVQIFAFAWSLDNTVWPYALKLLIDKILSFTGDKTHIWHYLMPVLLLWAGLWIGLGIAYRLQWFLMAKVFPKFEAQIRIAMFHYVSGHSYEFFSNNFAGNIANKLNDMSQSAVRIAQLVITLFVPAGMGLLIASYMFFQISFVFGLLIFGWAVLHVSICLLGTKKCAHLSNIYSTQRSILTGKIVDVFSNIINVKLFARKQYEYNYILDFQKNVQQKQTASLIVIEKLKIILDLSALIFPGILLTWYLIYCWQHNTITVGDVVLIINATWNIMLLIWISGLELTSLFKEIGICQQALSIIKEKHDITNMPGAQDLKIQKGEITFEKVNFQYSPGIELFKNFNLAIQGGEKIGLVGFSGSGKTTFVNLIMRFFDIDSGRILIDGIDITDVTIDSLRKQISMIPQMPSLFHRTVKENIAYGKIGANEEEILLASQHAHCHEFISKLPKGYDSLVGEHGIKLSGGQRQRIAIARAILENAPILILDEATSALDSVTEKYIQDALLYLMKNRTTIVIAHRLSTLAAMDRILVFSHGAIIEEGTHENLLAKQGHYFKMWQMQAHGFLPDALTEELNEEIE